MKALSSMATRHLLADLAAFAHSGGGSLVELESVGGVDAARRVAGGESVDLVFLAMDALERLAADAHLDPTSLAPVAVSQVAVAVPAPGGSPASVPQGTAFDDATGLRAALEAATKIGYSTGPSGTALLAHIEEWGLTDALRSRLVQARAGVPVAKALADGDVDLGFQQLSELVGQPGVRILGVLPPDCAIDTVFGGAVASAAAEPTAARALLDVFASPAAAPIVRAHSFSIPE